MKLVVRRLVLILLYSTLLVAPFLQYTRNTNYTGQHGAYAQSSVDSIKERIRVVVMAADGKVSLTTKNRLIEIIAEKIKTSSNAVVVDLYVYFLKEVKKLRTNDEIIAISTAWWYPSTTTDSQSSAPQASGPDFSVSFASTQWWIVVDQKFVTISIKIKNNGLSFSPDGLGSLKFGCKGIDGTIYPYWSYTDTQIIWSNSELVLEVPNVYIGNLTSNKGFKLLTCKIDSSDLITETNEDNNFVNVSVQIY